MVMRSCGRSCSTSAAKACLSSGSLSGSCIEPEVSTRNTRLAAGISDFSTRKPWMPTCSSWCFAFHGAGAISVLTRKGTSREAGAG
jgi:hypothetical protein